MKAKIETWSQQLDLAAIQGKYQTPSWLVSEAQLIQNVNEWLAFTTDASRILYPIKTNPGLSVLEILAQQGVGADCASKREIDLALYAGIPFSRITYNCPVQDMALCVYVLKNGGTIVLDDYDVMMELQENLSSLDFSGKVWIRINPNSRSSYLSKNENQDLMAHGAASSKFGFPVEDLPALLHFVTIPIVGIHLHVGTQMDNLDSFIEAMEHLHESAFLLEKFGHEVQDLDLGGGLGIPFTANDSFPSIEDFCAAMIPLKRAVYRYHIEPGHAIVGNAVGLILSVASIKESRGKKWAIVDAGTDLLAKITLLRWPHQILDPANQALPIQGKDVVAGPLCFAGDILLPETDISHLKVGDPVFVQTAGAYTHSLSNNFNGRNAPAWLLLNEAGEIFQKSRPACNLDGLELNMHEWKPNSKTFKTRELNLISVHNLSSPYLKTLISHDTYELLSFKQIGPKSYLVKAKVDAEVDFVSMPTAIRAIGDAGIIGFLDLENEEVKKDPIWGRRLILDCFEMIPIVREIEFEIHFSEMMQKSSGQSRLMHFNTSNGEFSGMFVLNRSIAEEQKVSKKKVLAEQL